MKKKEKHQEDNPFPPVNDGRLNALIGDNYFASDNYIDGYMKASEVMLVAIIENTRMYEADTLVFPILYSARHAVELSLKRVIEQLSTSGKTSMQRPVTGHNIKELWTQFMDISTGDKKSTDLRERLNVYIQIIADLDPDGQEFRYSKRIDGREIGNEQFLFGLPRVDIFIKELNEVLRKLRRRIDYFVDEIATGSVTKELSRSDLENISKRLPPRDQWKEADFRFICDEICFEYGLSNRALSRGIVKIKGHRQFGSNIGIEANLICAKDQTVMKIVEEHLEKYPPHPAPAEPEIIILNHCIKDILQDADFDEDIKRIERMVEASTVEELADVSTIYYLLKADNFIEFYEKTYGTRLQDFKQNGAGKSLSHIFEKLDLVTCLEMTIRKLGRIQLADMIAEAKLRAVL